MKTHTIGLFLFICLFDFAVKSEAQTYYYNSSKVFNENGYKYRCTKNIAGIVSLRNDSNVFTDAKYAFKDGSVFNEEMFFRNNVQLVADDNWTKQTSFSIINNAFSTAEKQRVNKKMFDVSMTIDTNTGRVIEVDFGFLYNDSFGTIPISTFRKIELELKSKIWFTMTNTGRRLTHLKCGWMHEVD